MRNASGITCKVAVLLAMAAAPAYAADLLSHAVIVVPEVRVQESWVKLIDTQEEWEAFFRTAYVSTGQDQEPPEIDFTRWRVVAGGTGVRNSGDTQLVIDRVHDMHTSVLVTGFVITTGHDCLVTQNVNYPTIAILIPQSPRPVQVGMLPAVFNCDIQSRYIPAN